jgi:polyphenol oxidase
MPPSASRATSMAELAVELSDHHRVPVMTWDFLGGSGATAVVTGREGGVSEGPYRSLNLGLHVGDDEAAVLENRRRALASIGAALDDLVVAEQVHGCGVGIVGGGDAGRGAFGLQDAVPSTDALVTTERGLVLAILVADCAPVVLFDPEAVVLGTVHAGWRGSTAGVVEATVAAMSQLGARTDRMLAGVGPAVAPDRYEVGEDVVRACTGHFGSSEPWARAGRPGHWWFDLPGVVGQALRRAGLRDEHIVDCGRSTGAAGPFYSFREEGTCGRFALLARIEP